MCSSTDFEVGNLSTCMVMETCPGGPVEEAQVLLEDHIVKSQAMAASPFSKPFEDRLVTWEKKLQRFQVCALYSSNCGITASRPSEVGYRATTNIHTPSI